MMIGRQFRCCKSLSGAPVTVGARTDAGLTRGVIYYKSVPDQILEALWAGRISLHVAEELLDHEENQKCHSHN